MNDTALAPDSHSSAQYRPEIDGLRAIAIILVVIYHAFPSFIPNGYIGVDVFFVISGFLINRLILNELKSKKFFLSHFYSKRIKRIFPALIVVLIITQVLGYYLLMGSDFNELSQHIAGASVFVSNFVLWNEAGYFDTEAAYKPFLHLWSLGVEEQFYLLWPLCLLFIKKLKIDFMLLSRVTFYVSISIYFLLHFMSESNSAFYLPISRFWEIMAGCILANRDELIDKNIISGAIVEKKNFANLQALLGLGLIITCSFSAYISETLLPVAAVTGAALIIHAGQKSSINQILLSSRLLVSIGLISYPLYLWHWPLLAFRNMFFESNEIFISLVIIISSVLLSIVTFKYIENPIRFGAGRTNFKIYILISCMLIIGLSNGCTYYFYERKISTKERLSAMENDLVEPSETRKSDGSCEKKLSINSNYDPYAVCLTNTSSPEILILGDSHAMAFFSSPFLDKTTAIRGLLIAEHSLYFTEHFRTGEYLKMVKNIVGKIDKIKVIVVVTRGPYYFLGGNNEQEISSIKSSNLKLFSEEKFREALKVFFSGLEQTGKHVVFVLDVPELPHPARFYYLRKTRNKISINQEALRITNFMNSDRERIYRKMIEEMRLNGVLNNVFDASSSLCDKDHCYVGDEKNMFYYDDDHLSITGSKKVWVDFNKYYDALDI